jgi:hypothetical protein
MPLEGQRVAIGTQRSTIKGQRAAIGTQRSAFGNMTLSPLRKAHYTTVFGRTGSEADFAPLL